MAATPARGRADYDYLIKLLLIGDSAYYRGAMGILLVYDVTDESSFNNIRNWIRNIEQHASDNVNKILVGNKADMDESRRAVPTSSGQALADEYGIKFFETHSSRAQKQTLMWSRFSSPSLETLSRDLLRPTLKQSLKLSRLVNQILPKALLLLQQSQHVVLKVHHMTGWSFILIANAYSLAIWGVDSVC
ncbi:ras-related protein Rab-8B-like isoform X3 [Tripterygium wilfordii]|uniref:ras-related protein Rab-8B-like isoform X3 n=1 Tax=Tripterygium wilfordii TaxID=458696 RepID=UPI0018F83095|nr:ras-related protein Rab-8B-like isoform X3 [Tripterygium wilfordii]